MLILMTLVSSFVFAQQGVGWVQIIFPDDVAFSSGDVIDVNLKVNVSGPISSSTMIEASIDDESSSMLLIDILDSEGFYYEDTGDSYVVDSSQSDMFLIYDAAGEHSVNLKVGGPDYVIESLEMNIVGHESDAGYVTFPSIDVGNDGEIEWQFFGDFLSYTSDFFEPNGLTSEEIEIEIKDESFGDRIYYCEVVDIPYAKNYQVHAYLKNNTGISVPGDLKATILSIDSPLSDFVDASGGSTFDCTLPVVEGVDFQYYSCDMSLGYTLEGEHLVCVYNNVVASGDNVQAYVMADGQGDSAYECKSSIDSGKFDCIKHSQGDYLIKLKAGEYSKELIGQTSFGEWLVKDESYFLFKLNDNIGDCKPVSGGCVITLDVKSESAGMISLQDLVLKYSTPGGASTTSSLFYFLNTEPGLITKIGSLNLFEGGLLEFSISDLLLIAPDVDEAKDYVLEVGLNPGPSNETDVSVVPSFGGIFNETSASGTVNAYVDFFSAQQSDYEDVLNLIGLGSMVDAALVELSSYSSQIDSISASNKTQEEKDSEIQDVIDGLDELVSSLPKSISVMDEVEDVIVVEPSDILDEMILWGDNAEDKTKLYSYQDKFTVDAVARYIEIELFDGSKIVGTHVSKLLGGRENDVVLFEVIPKSVVIDKNEAVFEGGFFLVDTDYSRLYHKEYTSVTGVSFSYFVYGDVIAGLSELKTVVVPKAGIAGSVPGLAPVCGDNVCTVLLVNGEEIPLEDEISCPEDCAKRVNWEGILLVFFIGVLIIVAAVVYFRLVDGKGKIVRTKGVADAKILFSRPRDETILRNYVVKSLASGLSKNKITEVLMKSGWKKEQVNYVFKTLSKRRK